jgi:hypothetical protein
MHHAIIGTSTNAGVVVDKNIDKHYMTRQAMMGGGTGALRALKKRRA